MGREHDRECHVEEVGTGEEVTRQDEGSNKKHISVESTVPVRIKRCSFWILDHTALTNVLGASRSVPKAAQNADKKWLAEFWIDYFWSEETLSMWKVVSWFPLQ